MIGLEVRREAGWRHGLGSHSLQALMEILDEEKISC
jgi:hypothetical protein